MPPDLRPFEEHARLGERRRLQGVDIVAAQRQDAVALIQREMARGGPVRVAFANANMLNLAARDDAYREMLTRFIVFNDGLGVDVASRLKFGAPFPDNLNGTDFVPYFLSQTAPGLRLFLLGGQLRAVEQAAAAIAGTWPAHEVVGCSHGYFSDPSDELCVAEAVRACRADAVLVGRGNPRQEFWIDLFADRSGAKVLMGVGALFDFLSGETRRAPKWVRDARCEWLFRLAQEPRRLSRRYITGGVTFVGRSLRDALRY